MNGYDHKINFKKFFLTIILPTLITIGLFVFLIFIYIIPYFEQSMLDGKKEMIRELVNSSISIAAKYEQESSMGLLSIYEAKKEAVTRIEYLRYGIDDKDYFWITDMHPNMIMHPYRKDLNGKDLSDFSDPNGKKLFVEMVNRAKQEGEGYVDYEWQWMDDSSHIVPKISYVKEFKPWGWIIGTGIYIEDVKKEISAIKQKLTYVSSGISLLMIILLILIIRQNLKVELKRTNAENELKISREKYKALVEASTEGTGMILEGDYVYKNKKLEDILQCQQTDKVSINLEEIINPSRTNDLKAIKDFNESNSNYLQIETEVINKDRNIINALLSVSKVMLEGKRGLIITIKELKGEEIQEIEINERARNLLLLLEKSDTGIFKAELKRGEKFTDANENLAKIFGFESRDELLETKISNLIEDDDRRKLLNILDKEKFILDYPVKARKKNGLILFLSVSAVIQEEEVNSQDYIFGIIRDTTEQSTTKIIKDDVFNDMRVSMSYLNEEVRTRIKSVISCDMNTPVTNTIKIMTDNGSDFILITSNINEYTGILTDYDIRTRIFTSENNMGKPIYEFMSSPIISVNGDVRISDALILMRDKKISHLAVKDSKNKICGIITEKDLVSGNMNTSEFLISDVNNSSSVKGLKDVFTRIPFYIDALIESGARTYNITNSISGIADAITNKLTELITSEMGNPPVPFSFIALGSEGRKEQTLVTDQDNAIIYSDTDGEKSEDTSRYFLEFGNRMSDRLNDVGYKYCKGDIMSKNPKWCQPLTMWKRYFTKWIRKAEPQDLLDTAIFFDLRCISGDKKITEDLSEYIMKELTGNPVFINQMARVCIQYKTPLSIFGKIQTETKDEHIKSINIKNPCRVIVNLVRLYSMKNGITETNTINRIRQLYERNFISSSLYSDLIYSFDFLMLLQFKAQVKEILGNRKADNFVDLADLSGIEANTLKDVFSQISVFQSKLKYDFGIKE